MISRTDLENSNFQTCPNHCDWDTLVFNNDILYNFPKLQEEWSDKNGLPVHLALSHIETKKYWWKCSVCQGEYLCSIPIRKEVIDSCPYCNDEQALKGYNTIADTYPELCDLWSSKNLEKPDEVTKSAESENKIFNWICDCCDLEFKERLGIVLGVFTNNNSNSLNSICPYCNKKIPKPNETLSYVKPYLNNDQCCPYCSFKKTAKGYNDLETTHPWLIKEWSTFNKQEMSSVRENSTYNAWWKCHVCTGEYQQVIKEKFYRDNSCPYCRNQKVLKGFNDLATTQQSLMNKWDYLNNFLIASPTEITELSNMSVWWICQENLNHRYKIQVKERMAYRKRNKKACSN